MITLNFIINALLFIFTILTLKEQLFKPTDKYPQFSFRRISTIGWSILILCFAIFVLNIIKDKLDDKKQEEAEALQQKLITKAIDSTYKNSIKASNEVLAKYSLSITDSFRSVAKILNKNALKTQLIIAPYYPNQLPVYIVKKNNKTILNVKFESTGGISYNIYLNGMIIDYNYKILINEPITISILPETNTTTTSTILPPQVLACESILIFITGEFSKDLENKDKKPFNDGISFNLKDNKVISRLGVNFDTFKEKLKKNNPDKLLPF